MNRTFKLKHLFLSFFCGSLFFSGISYAASATSIEVYFQPLKYFFDGSEKKAPDEQQGFIYNGTTYVPLRFISESLGKKIGWDGKTHSIYVGKQPEGVTVNLLEVRTHTATSNNLLSVEQDASQELKSNTGEKYIHGFYVGYMLGACGGSEWPGSFTNEYLLNDQYKSFEAVVAPSYCWNEREKTAGVGKIKVYGDEKLIYEKSIDSDITAPIQVKVDLTGVLRLKIEMSGSSVGFFEPKLIQ